MKVIFLDVDGVLNSTHWYILNHKRHKERCRADTAINPRFVKNLRTIVRLTGAKIVLSATCRASVKKDNQHYLRKILEKYGLSIYDYTPKTGEERGIDIQQWLDQHQDVTNIVILDDDSDMGHLLKYLVKTVNYKKGYFLWFFQEGLCFIKILQAIKVLKKEYVNIYKIKNVDLSKIRKRF